MVQKDMRPREQRTFARSNVLGNDEAATRGNDGNLHKPVARDEGKWQSNVFAGPKANPITRKNLEGKGAGKGGLYGDSEPSSEWTKKQSFAAAISKKEETRPVVFDNSGADERKARELHGANYKPPPKSPAMAKAQTPGNFNSRSMKAQNL